MEGLGASGDMDECSWCERHQRQLKRRDQGQQCLQFDRVSIQQNYGNREACQVLLMREILVDRYEGIEGRAGECKELPIRGAGPAHLSDGANLVRSERAAQPARNRFVKQQTHRP